MHFSNAIWSLGKKTTSELRAIMEMYAYVCIKYKESIVGSILVTATILFYLLIRLYLYGGNNKFILS